MTNTTRPSDYALNLPHYSELLTYASDLSKDLRGYRDRSLCGLPRERLLEEVAYFEGKIDEAQEEDLDANWQKYA